MADGGGQAEAGEEEEDEVSDGRIRVGGESKLENGKEEVVLPSRTVRS